ncbi:MAG: hypothetical protein L0H79_14325 [Intrasporangium sp.]|uniref:hypothetical protein n=1 Tax=Intrasporangium sp. TaxID=1925024 RepID=UPI00264A2B57|nr:hypothetical protein [Intrasporangium sp.]MDN5796917.1 hypothetical protein [Intrasporangium sp.]
MNRHHDHQPTVVNSNPKYPMPVFMDPPTAGYLHVAPSVDPPGTGPPFVRPSRRRAATLEQLRPYDQIDKPVSTRLDPGENPDSFLRRCTELAAHGIQHAIVITAGPWTRNTITTLAAVIPALEQISPPAPGSHSRSA